MPYQHQPFSSQSKAPSTQSFQYIEYDPKSKDYNVKDHPDLPKYLQHNYANLESIYLIKNFPASAESKIYELTPHSEKQKQE